MRLGHLIFVVALIALGLTVARDPFGRVFVVVFFTGLGEVVFGLVSLMALFQTIGAIGEAKTVASHVEALAATTVVLAAGTALMSGWLFAGVWLVVSVA